MNNHQKYSAALLFGKTPAVQFGGATAKAVYIALGNYASEDNGFSCWPSLETIANVVGRSVQTVSTALKILQEGGWIARSHRFVRGMHTTSMTTLCIDKIKAAIAALKPRKPKDSGSQVDLSKLSRSERQKYKKEVKRDISLARNHEKSFNYQREVNSDFIDRRSTRQIPLDEDLTNTSWAK